MKVWSDNDPVSLLFERQGYQLVFLSKKTSILQWQSLIRLLRNNSNRTGLIKMSQRHRLHTNRRIFADYFIYKHQLNCALPTSWFLRIFFIQDSDFKKYQNPVYSIEILNYLNKPGGVHLDFELCLEFDCIQLR